MNVLKFGEVNSGWKMDGGYVSGDDRDYIVRHSTIILLLTQIEG